MDELLWYLITFFIVGLTLFLVNLFISKKLPAINKEAVAFLAGILLFFYSIIGYISLLILYVKSSEGITFASFCNKPELFIFKFYSHGLVIIFGLLNLFTGWLITRTKVLYTLTDLLTTSSAQRQPSFLQRFYCFICDGKISMQMEVREKVWLHGILACFIPNLLLYLFFPFLLKMSELIWKGLFYIIMFSSLGGLGAYLGSKFQK